MFQLHAVFILFVICTVIAQQRPDLSQDLFSNNPNNDNQQGPQLIGNFFNRGSFGAIVQPEPADTVS